MAGGFQVQIEKSDAWKRAAGALARLARFRMAPLHAEVGEYLVGETADRFRESADPEGRPWQALKRPRRRARGGKRPRRIKILVATGHLRGSVSYRADEKGVAVGTNLRYAARHNFGFEKDGKLLTPKRQFLGIGSRNTTDIVGIVTDHLDRAVQG